MLNVPDVIATETAAHPAASRPLDYEKLNILRKALPLRHTRGFISLFQHSAENHLGLILDHVTAQDFPAIAAQARNLVNMADNIGAVQTCDQARIVELAARDGNGAVVAMAIPALRDAVAAFSQALDAWREDFLGGSAQQKSA